MRPLPGPHRSVFPPFRSLFCFSVRSADSVGAPVHRQRGDEQRKGHADEGQEGDGNEFVQDAAGAADGDGGEPDRFFDPPPVPDSDSEEKGKDERCRESSLERPLKEPEERVEIEFVLRL